MNPASSVCVHFAIDADTCVARVAARTDHPTIPFGGGQAAVADMSKAFVPPTVGEGFDRVITLSSSEEADALLRRWGAVPSPPPALEGFFKFPRTQHVLNTGVQ